MFEWYFTTNSLFVMKKFFVIKNNDKVQWPPPWNMISNVNVLRPSEKARNDDNSDKQNYRVWAHCLGIFGNPTRCRKLLYCLLCSTATNTILSNWLRTETPTNRMPRTLYSGVFGRAAFLAPSTSCIVALST